MADIRLPKPAAGASETVPCAPEARFVFDFPATDATLARDGDNLAIQFEDGSRLNLEGFYTEYNEENLPSFSIDGTEVAAADFFAAMNEPDLMPAAGPGAGTPTGGRFHEWGDASLADGIDHLNGLDWGFSRAFEWEDHPNAVGGGDDEGGLLAQGPAIPGTSETPDVPGSDADPEISAAMTTFTQTKNSTSSLIDFTQQHGDRLGENGSSQWVPNDSVNADSGQWPGVTMTAGYMNDAEGFEASGNLYYNGYFEDSSLYDPENHNPDTFPGSGGLSVSHGGLDTPWEEIGAQTSGQLQEGVKFSFAEGFATSEFSITLGRLHDDGEFLYCTGAVGHSNPVTMYGPDNMKENCVLDSDWAYFTFQQGYEMSGWFNNRYETGADGQPHYFLSKDILAAWRKNTGESGVPDGVDPETLEFLPGADGTYTIYGYHYINNSSGNVFSQKVTAGDLASLMTSSPTEQAKLTFYKDGQEVESILIDGNAGGVVHWQAPEGFPKFDSVVVSAVNNGGFSQGQHPKMFANSDFTIKNISFSSTSTVPEISGTVEVNCPAGFGEGFSEAHPATFAVTDMPETLTVSFPGHPEAPVSATLSVTTNPDGSETLSATLLNGEKLFEVTLNGENWSMQQFRDFTLHGEGGTDQPVFTLRFTTTDANGKTVSATAEVPVGPDADVVGQYILDHLKDNAAYEVLDDADGKDELRGGDGDELISGGDGDDVISGGAGNDIIQAGNGNDVIIYDGADTLINGGAGIDFLLGGAKTPGLDVLTGKEPNENGERLPVVRNVEVLLKGDGLENGDLGSLEKLGVTPGEDGKLQLDYSIWNEKPCAADGIREFTCTTEDGRELTLQTTLEIGIDLSSKNYYDFTQYEGSDTLYGMLYDTPAPDSIGLPDGTSVRMEAVKVTYKSSEAGSTEIRELGTLETTYHEDGKLAFGTGDTHKYYENIHQEDEGNTGLTILGGGMHKQINMIDNQNSEGIKFTPGSPSTEFTITLCNFSGTYWNNSLNVTAEQVLLTFYGEDNTIICIGRHDT